MKLARWKLWLLTFALVVRVLVPQGYMTIAFGEEERTRMKKLRDLIAESRQSR